MASLTLSSRIRTTAIAYFSKNAYPVFAAGRRAARQSALAIFSFLSYVHFIGLNL